MRTRKPYPRFTRAGGAGEQTYFVIMNGLIYGLVRRVAMDLPWGGYAWRWQVLVRGEEIGHEKRRLLAGFMALRHNDPLPRGV